MAKSKNEVRDTNKNESQKVKRRKKGKKNKPEVILDFTKRAKPKKGDTAKDIISNTNKNAPSRSKRGRMTLTTNFQDYGGSLNVPEQIKQRDGETTGQFLRRIDRLVAVTKVDANMQERFNK